MISRNCSASMDSVPNVCCVVLVSSHAFLRASASSLLTLWPRHVRCIRLEAFRRSRSCWRCCLSCWALATVFWVPEAEGDQVLAANGFRFWPERLTWRGRRELPLKVWNISNRCSASFGDGRALPVTYLGRARDMPGRLRSCSKKRVADPLRMFLLQKLEFLFGRLL